MSKSNNREIVEKAIKVFSLRVFSYGFGFLFIWILANKFGAKMQGIFSIAFLFLSVGVMIAKLGIETSLVKWIASAESIELEKYIFKKAIGITILSGVLTGVILFLLAPLISKMYQKPDILKSIQWISLGVPFLVILDVTSNFFKGRTETTTYGIYFFIIKFLFPLIFLSIFFFSGALFYEIPSIAYALGLLIASILILGHVWLLFKGTQSLKKIKLTSKFIILESYPMMVSSSMVLIMGWSDVFVLGFFVSEEQIGIYSTAVKLATIVSFTYAAIATITTPKIAEYFDKNKIDKLKETIFFSSRIMVLCGLPIFLILFIFPEFFLSFFGEDYVVGANVLRILLVAQLTNVITGPVGPVFQMTGNQKKLQNFIIIALIVNIILSLLLVMHFNLEGVAFASAIGMMFWNVIGSMYLKRKLKIQTWAKLN
ncbi:MAG: flippase [Urechidicola sp.]|nr:flippase [Urechidicola sp.]